VALQRPQADPGRPRLESGADTNDATVYYAYGVTRLERDAVTAAAAFHWATRLEPGWPEALYARRVAGFMANPRLLVNYFQGERSAVLSSDAQRLDSLEYRAQKLNPFFPRDLDKPLFFRYVVAWVEEDRARYGERPMGAIERGDLEFWVEGALRSVEVSPWLRAHLAESRRRFPEALQHYRSALQQGRDRVEIHKDLAHLFFIMEAYDSSLAHLQAAVDELRRRDEDRLVRLYQSKELLEHATGLIHERRGEPAAAREAYGRSLQENLSYYPSHLRLGMLALAAGDTAQAIQELELGVEVAPAEPTLRVTYGALLARVGRLEDAVTHLRKAVDLEPYYARPYYLLGRIGESRGQREQALADYRAFLARASQRDPRRDEVLRRVADLESMRP
jgi:tetratricopeptide (TPR) repeat protein